MATPDNLIKPQFQFGDRHGESVPDYGGESAGNGAIDAFATWDRALSATEVQTVAGGSGRSVTVAGAATLNLISGTFTGSLLPTANNASVTGAKELIIGTSADNEPTVDLSNARTIGNTKTTTATPFDTITVRTDLKLGAHRFTDTVIKSDDDTKVHNLTVTVTPEELAAMAGTHSETGGAYYPGAIDLGPFDGWVADDFTLTVENEDTLTMPVQYEQATWGLAVRTIDNTDHLCVVLENRDPNLIWEEANAGATDDWMAGLPNFIPNDRVTFKANRNNAAETVNIGNKAYTLGAIAFTEGGNYTLAGTGSLTAGTTTANGATLTVETTVNAGNTTLTDTDLTVSGDATLSADTLTLDGASTLHLGTKPYSFRYVRFTFTGVVGNQEGLVLFDLELLRDGEKVPWNGATGTNDAARLMDGTSNNWSKAHPTATIPVSVAFDAGIDKVFTFDGYRFMSSYFKSRTPTTWTVEGSNDNATWQVLDSRNYDADTVRAWFAGRETEPNGDTDKISLTWTPAQTMIDDAVTARYVRWVPTHRVAGSNNWMGLAEFQLLHNGEPVAWPSGTATNAGSGIHQPHPAGSGTNAASTNEVDVLIDGDFTTSWRSFTDSNAPARGNIHVTFDAGEDNAFTFDAYRLAMTRNGNNPANPCGWEVWVSDAPAMNADNTALSTTTNESTGWTRVDTQCYNRDESWGEWPNNTATVTNGWTYSVYPDSTASITATTTINGTLAGRGHVYGTVTFGDGSVIDVSGADRGFIAVDGVPTITAKADGSAGQVRILAPDDFVGEELQLFGWNGLNQADDVPPAGMTQESFVLANGTNGTLPCYDLEVRPSGVYMVNKTVVYDAANTKLTEVHDPMPTALYNELRMLATQEGKREVHVVAYTRGNTAFAKQWASVYAPQVFQGDGLYEFAQDGDRDVLKVSYEFGISRLWFSTDDTGTTQVNVTATLSSVDDTTGDLTFVPGSIVRLRAEKTQADDYGNAVYIGDPLATETVGEGVHEVTFTIPYTNLESVMQDSNFKGLRVEIVTSAGK